MSCPHAHDDGPYVLGALPAAERLEFERHLQDCDECTRSVRAFAGLPGLLSRVDPDVVENPPEQEPLPDTLLPALSRQVHRARRRRTRAGIVLAAAAAAVLAVLVVSGVGSDEEPSRDVAQEAQDPDSSSVLTGAMRPVGEVPVRAELTLEQVTWGTRLDLTCTYDTESVEYQLPPAVDYYMFVRTREGRAEQVGSWRSVDGRTMQLAAATASDRDDISSVEVRAPDGRVVLRLRL